MLAGLQSVCVWTFDADDDLGTGGRDDAGGHVDLGLAQCPRPLPVTHTFGGNMAVPRAVGEGSSAGVVILTAHVFAVCASIGCKKKKTTS